MTNIVDAVISGWDRVWLKAKSNIEIGEKILEINELNSKYIPILNKYAILNGSDWSVDISNCIFRDGSIYASRDISEKNLLILNGIDSLRLSQFLNNNLRRINGWVY